MQKKRANGLGYVLQLAGKNKSLFALSALCSVLSGLCTFAPYIMSYQVLVRIFDHQTSIDAIIKCGITAVVSIILKFIFQILALALSHIGAFNTLYIVRSELSKHIAKIHLGFFTDNSSGEIKKIIIEDTERIEKFLAHQIPDLVTAAAVPILMLCYMFNLSVLMTVSLLLPLLLGFIIMAIALKITSNNGNGSFRNAFSISKKKFCFSQSLFS